MSYVTLLDDNKPLTELVNDHSDGLGILQCTKCTCTEELNGQFILQFSLPITDKHYAELHEKGLVRAKPNETDDEQIFRIVNISVPMKGVVSVNANHISYDMNAIAVNPFETTGIANAINGLKSNVVGYGSGQENLPFSIWTNITDTTKAFAIAVPTALRTCLGGMEGSLLDTFGGEYQWDNLQAKLFSIRGEYRYVTIEYGKNLIDANQERNIEDTYDAVLGYAKFADDSDQKKDKVYVGDLQYPGDNIPAQPRTLIVDFSQNFDDDHPPNKQIIETLAHNYAVVNDINVPKISIKVKFTQLQNSEEYKNIAQLEHVSLGDRVGIMFPKLGINTTERIRKTVFNVIKDRYDSVEIGSNSSSLSKTISNIGKTSSAQLGHAKTVLDQASKHASRVLTGALGGHVMFHSSSDADQNEQGFPDEIIVSEKLDMHDQNNCIIRINKAGIFFGEHGYDGDLKSAWTIDGTFFADYIAAGQLDCDKLRDYGARTGRQNCDVTNMDAERVSENEFYDDVIPGLTDEDITIVNWNGYLCHYVYKGRKTSYWVEEHEDYYWRQIYRNAGGDDSHG